MKHLALSLFAGARGFRHRGLSRNGVKNYSKGPCVTILE